MKFQEYLNKKTINEDGVPLDVPKDYKPEQLINLTVQIGNAMSKMEEAIASGDMEKAKSYISSAEINLKDLKAEMGMKGQKFSKHN